MGHSNKDIERLLQGLDLGSSVAEVDTLLEVARVETSAFSDLLNDKVDLVPGTKGSGKSALFRIFVNFLPDRLLQYQKVVVAHGVDGIGDPVFHSFKEEFEELDEEGFVEFWCIYLVSLIHEQFIKGARYSEMLSVATAEVDSFRKACAVARIPEIAAKKSLFDILQWALNALKTWRPKIKYRPPQEAGEFELDLFGQPALPSVSQGESTDELPRYIHSITTALEKVLKKTRLFIWLMVDRLDEVFPRRSQVERLALRGLLRAMKFFSSESVRVKVFLRDDMLEQLLEGNDGFTALTHITARQADTLRWTQDQIVAMLLNRISANADICAFLNIDKLRLVNQAYRQELFYQIFPATVHRGPKQTPTMKWIYSRCSDGKQVVTPRDVLDLVIRAKQKQQDLCNSDPTGTSEWLIGPTALQYGLAELSARKKNTYLHAEFPHLWNAIEKFVGGKTEYGDGAMRRLLGSDHHEIVEDLVSIGLFAKRTRNGSNVFWVPYLYRYGLSLTQGKA